MENFKKFYPKIDVSKMLIKKGFYKSMRSDLQNLDDWNFNDFLLISYDYVVFIPNLAKKNIITHRTLAKIPNIIDYFDNIANKYDDIHINYIFSITNHSSFSINQYYETSLQNKYFELLHKFVTRNKLTKYKDGYIFNRNSLTDEFQTILSLIRQDFSKIRFINDSVYINFNPPSRLL